MKKILAAMVVTLSFAGTASAGTLVTAGSGYAIRGGADAATASAAPTPLIKFSTGVWGLINSTPDTTAKTSTGYVIATRHTTGSKDFGTASNRTNIFWKQASAITASVSASQALANDVGSDDETGATFAAGKGWTSY
ncbi:geopilin domain 2 protein [Citrifermentans bemidjiense Bem]|uniref:Geopilin domain 2 protein n=1 Tax=Citrifermentans bemidjiense (strain ATCC BAA-1014 / DSM 16622 / JCM 12645 / Bem) TaxID=404380 RepID=B5EGW4_CITBB|nr:hypothetical protein [Citrifermentans bemidjiense]ACH39597.1 geopilin domain 2 protein [Citrifermentans bemidjiense Bem]